MSASKSPASQAPAKMAPTKDGIRTPVRSGQQIYAKDSDLVVLLSHVSEGAEVIADGSVFISTVHLRGRAIAGASGQHWRKVIICNKLQCRTGMSIAGTLLAHRANSKDEFWQQKDHVQFGQRRTTLKFDVLAL